MTQLKHGNEYALTFFLYKVCHELADPSSLSAKDEHPLHWLGIGCHCLLARIFTIGIFTFSFGGHFLSSSFVDIDLVAKV